ncbi:MAG: hypothetical protein R2750_06845 [Bacteroidales bacterium]
MLLITTGVLYHFKDEIGKKIFLSANNIQQGRFYFSDISFSPFVHFPSVSVHLKNVVYLEHALDNDTISNDTIAKLNSLYASINLVDMIYGNINVSKVTLDGGELRLVMYPDSSVNLMNAIKPKIQNPSDDRLPLPNKKSASDSSNVNDISSILLTEISIKNFTIASLDLKDNKTTIVYLDKLRASFSYYQDTIQCAIKTTANLNSIPISDRLLLKDKTLTIETAIYYDKSERELRIDPGHLIFENANFQIHGSINFSDTGFVDIIIKGVDEDMNLFNLLLTESGVKNLKSGKIYFNGSIKGSNTEEIPCFDFNFGLENLNLDIPDKNQSIADLNLEGNFNSGTRLDLSQAKLKVDNFNGQLPDGFINASLNVENFSYPKIDLLWEMEADITGFDEIFNIGEIENLSGRIEIFDEFIGSINLDSMFIDERKSITKIILDSVSFNLPGIMNVLNLNGQLHQNKDTIHFYNLSVISDHTDLLINGHLYNLPDLITGKHNEMSANLTIKSDTFNFPQFLSFEPKVGESFPYRILNMDLDVHAWSTTEKLMNYNVNPEINFEIYHLDGTIENLFPPVSIRYGEMFLGEKNQRIHMTFDNFDLSIADGQLNINVEYFSPLTDPDEISVNLELTGLNPGKLFFYDQDSSNFFKDGTLSGKLNSDFTLSLDSIDFEMFNFVAEKLEYKTKTDTFDFDQFSIHATNIYLGSTDQHPLGNLCFNADFEMSNVFSNHFQLDHQYYKVETKNGIFTIVPEKIELFGAEGKGIYVLSPFLENPNYEVKYSVQKFPMSRLQSNFMLDTLMTGNIDIEANISLVEDEEIDFLSGLNGYVHIYGKDLLLYGMDLDKVIKKFQKTQRFSLVDVGAVALAGPFGLALTKGSQYANLAINKTNDSTLIKQLISEWAITNGKILLDDVAFSTIENRVVGKGWVNLATDSLKVVIAVVDINGCSILSQTIKGLLEDPQKSDIKIVGTVLAPITNLVGGALGKDCDRIYQGKLEHPLYNKKRKNE